MRRMIFARSFSIVFVGCASNFVPDDFEVPEVLETEHCRAASLLVWLSLGSATYGMQPRLL